MINSKVGCGSPVRHGTVLKAENNAMTNSRRGQIPTFIVLILTIMTPFSQLYIRPRLRRLIISLLSFHQVNAVPSKLLERSRGFLEQRKHPYRIQTLQLLNLLAYGALSAIHGIRWDCPSHPRVMRPLRISIMFTDQRYRTTPQEAHLLFKRIQHQPIKGNLRR